MPDESQIAEIERQIAELSAVMKGPMLPFDRACAHADRKELREKLRTLQGKG